MTATSKGTNRLTILEQVYYQSAEDEPKGIESRFTRLLETTEEQPYQRKLRIGTEWKPLDAGWIERASFYVVSNQEGKHLQQIPSEEEKLESSKRIIELGIATPSGIYRFASIPPGEFQRVGSSEVKNVRIRCLSGLAKATVTVYPE